MNESENGTAAVEARKECGCVDCVIRRRIEQLEAGNAELERQAKDRLVRLYVTELQGYCLFTPAEIQKAIAGLRDQADKLVGEHAKMQKEVAFQRERVDTLRKTREDDRQLIESLQRQNRDLRQEKQELTNRVRTAELQSANIAAELAGYLAKEERRWEYAGPGLAHLIIPRPGRVVLKCGDTIFFCDEADEVSIATR